MFKLSAISVDASVQTLAKAGDRLKNTPFYEKCAKFSVIIREKIC